MRLMKLITAMLIALLMFWSQFSFGAVKPEGLLLRGFESEASENRRGMEAVRNGVLTTVRVDAAEQIPKDAVWSWGTCPDPKTRESLNIMRISNSYTSIWRPPKASWWTRSNSKTSDLSWAKENWSMSKKPALTLPQGPPTVCTKQLGLIATQMHT